jgi:hypothetical protein
MTRPILGFKSFWSAAVTLAGVELTHMIRKDQLLLTGELRPAVGQTRSGSHCILFPFHI